MQQLAGKTVLVTGASKGIGASIAKCVGRAGARVIAHYSSDREGAEGAVADVEPENRTLVQADFDDLAAVERAWDEAWDWGGGIDVLVNNAAIMLWDGGFASDTETWDETWERTLRVNVLAPAPNTVTVGLPDIVRGPGQSVDVPADSASRTPDTSAVSAESDWSVECAERASWMRASAAAWAFVEAA